MLSPSAKSKETETVKRNKQKGEKPSSDFSEDPLPSYVVMSAQTQRLAELAGLEVPEPVRRRREEEEARKEKKIKKTHFQHMILLYFKLR